MATALSSVHVCACGRRHRRADTLAACWARTCWPWWSRAIVGRGPYAVVVTHARDHAVDVYLFESRNDRDTAARFAGRHTADAGLFVVTFDIGDRGDVILIDGRCHAT